jgi:Holliday junction DNA helicase RuvA
MISFLKGKIIEKKPTEVVIETNSVGFTLLISLKTFEALPEIDESTFIQTLLIPREDAITLYGFATKSEREMFTLLTSVNGIGPKSAITILSSVDSEQLYTMILTSNSYQLQKFPGIGKKTAERIILELKDKVGKISTFEGSSDSYTFLSNKSEAIEALIILGYNKIASEKVINEILKSESSTIETEDLIKRALSKLLK